MVPLRPISFSAMRILWSIHASRYFVMVAVGCVGVGVLVCHGLRVYTCKGGDVPAALPIVCVFQLGSRDLPDDQVAVLLSLLQIASQIHTVAGAAQCSGLMLVLTQNSGLVTESSSIPTSFPSLACRDCGSSQSEARMCIDVMMRGPFGCVFCESLM